MARNRSCLLASIALVLRLKLADQRINAACVDDFGKLLPVALDHPHIADPKGYRPSSPILPPVFSSR